MDKLLVICGPTATGKTALAAHFAKKYNGELISADSRQVYRSMDLTTGKDRPDVPIWLYDIVNPDEEFSVSHWVSLAREAMSEIQKRNKLPIIVGGTGLYIHALLHPLETIHIPPDPVLRRKLKDKTVEELQDMINRDSMNESDWNNPRRLIRKIELAKANVKSGETRRSFDALIIGLTAPLQILYERIDARLEERKKSGLKKEIELLAKKYSTDLPSMSAIGLNEHAYARRQLTWFKKQKDIKWFDITQPGYVGAVASVVRAWYN